LFAQAPLASQYRACNGSDVQVPGSSFPVGTWAQVPSELLRLHCMQVPLQSVLQQTPSAQWPLAQSAKLLQMWPGRALHWWLGSQDWSLGQVSSGRPAGTGLQVPALPATLQAMQVPEQSALDTAQQTPSTQNPEAQDDAALGEQPEPFWRGAVFAKYSQISCGP
jgi:hypothetical protein